MVHTPCSAIRRFAPSRNGDARRELGLGTDDILVTAVGNVRPAKAYDVLLRAAGILRRRSDRYRFIVVGEGHGRLLDDLLALRDHLALGSAVRFLGFRADVAPLLQCSDVLVSSSDSEGFSLSVIQALACGVPVIATRSGGPNEILVDGVHGLRVDTGSPDQITAAVERVVRDGALRRRLAYRGRELVEHRYAVETMIARYSRLYELHARAAGRATTS